MKNPKIKPELSLSAKLLACLPNDFTKLDKPGVWARCKKKMDKIWKLAGLIKEISSDIVDFRMHKYQQYYDVA